MNRTCTKLRLNQWSGYGLLEVLLAFALSSLVIVWLTEHYLTIKRHHHHVHQSLETAMDLQFIATLLRQTIQHAGFTPCASVEHLTRYDHRKNAPIVAIRGGASLAVNHMTERFHEVTSVLDPSHALVDGENDLHVGETVMMSDCEHAEVNLISKIEKQHDLQKITFQQPLRFLYPSQAFVGAWLEDVFFIAKQGGLFFKVNGHTEALSMEVRAMQLQQQQHTLTITLNPSQSSEHVMVATMRNV